MKTIHIKEPERNLSNVITEFVNELQSLGSEIIVSLQIGTFLQNSKKFKKEINIPEKKQTKYKVGEIKYDNHNCVVFVDVNKSYDDLVIDLPNNEKVKIELDNNIKLI